MDSKQREFKISSDLKFSIPLGFHREKIIRFISENLSAFSVEFVNSDAVARAREIKKEDYISQELSLFLNNMVATGGYLFTHQSIGPDIFVRQFGASVHSLILLYIEAKRLYAAGKKNYVESGIGRFKREEHGKQDDIAIMLGYMQEKTFSYWENKVNLWIGELINDQSQNPKWESQDKLTIVKISDVANYKSSHSRVEKKPIILYHFWINLCRN